MSAIAVIALAAAAAFATMTVAWVISLVRRDASVADVAWGIAFIAIAWVGFVGLPGDPSRALIVALLVTAWGLRLAAHVAIRSHGRPEDRRYARWREQAGDAFWWRSLFTVFWLQAGLAVIIAAPILGAQIGAAPDTLPLRWLGVLVFTIGLALESIADAQLLRHQARSSGSDLLTSGLWRYSRHPNYFGECVVWWGLWLCASSAGPWIALATVPGPILITFLLLRVSGVPLLERDARRKPGFEEWARQTSAFIPLPPGKDGMAPGEHEFIRSQVIPLPRDRVFAFFSDASNLEAITPPELSFRILTPLPVAMSEGTLIDYALTIHGLPVRWRSRISLWRPPHEFVDEQLRGPYAAWTHHHGFVEDGGATVVTDRVRYRLPLHPLSAPFHPLVRRQLHAIFDHRARVLAQRLHPFSGGA